MEVKPSRGRGGSGKRGGRGGHDGDSHSGEYRGRGRGGHHRSRGKRDHYRGRGRAGGGHTADYSRRDQDDVDLAGDEDVTQSFSRRKLESNWNRYESTETPEMDEDMPTQRGADYTVLLQSAGDCFTQFRFSDEKDWEMDSFVAGQMCALLDLSSLAQSLERVPLEHRLQLETQLMQMSTPVELPAPSHSHTGPAGAVPSAPRFSVPKASAPLHTVSAVSPSPLKTAPSPAEGAREGTDRDLDELLSFQKAEETQEKQWDSDKGTVVVDTVFQEVKTAVPEAEEDKDKMAAEEEEVSDIRAAPVKRELTEDDLEDWLDSIIS